MPFTLDSKVALITGAGRGIGRAIAEKLAAAGAAVMINDLDPAPAAEAEAAIRQSGRAAAHLAGDVTAADFPQQLVDATLATFGGLDIIVNNAGYTWDNVIQKTTDEQYLAMLGIHLVAPFRILRAASTHIREAAKREAAEGRRVMRKVVNITSIAGTDGNPGQAGYSSGKAGVIGLTKTMCKEWARYNVQSNCVAFGFIDTRLTQDKEKGITVEAAGQKIAVGVPEKVRQGFIQMIPMGRPGTPEEAANALLFFASPLSDYVSGQLLVVGGGFSM